MSQGWIKLHRKVMHCMFWMDKPFDKARAWIDLLLMANHEGRKFLLGTEAVEVEKGSFITSIRKLTLRWGWSNTKVNSFLGLLQDEKMIVQKSDTKKTLITVMNWDLYQSSGDEKTSQKRHENVAKTSQKHTNKNDKNVKNEKNIYVPEFETFWNLYIRQTEKKSAFSSWQARVKEGHTPEEIILATKNYMSECKKLGTDVKFIKHPKTFLGPSGHIDEWKVKGQAQTPKPQERQRTEMELAMDKLVAEMRADGQI